MQSSSSSHRDRSIAEQDDTLKSLEQSFDMFEANRRVIKPNPDTEATPEVQSTDPSPKQPPRRRTKRKKWVRPEPGWVKTNVAAVFIKDPGQAAIGMIVRNEHGRVLWSACKFLDHCSSEKEAQLIACKEGLDLARVTPGRHILETECAACAALTHCAACGAPLTRPAKGGPSNLDKVKQDILDLKKGFWEVRFERIRKCQNTIAHELADHGRTSSKKVNSVDSICSNVYGLYGAC
ncbi:hypothetical protein QOZ80_7AG0554930 [Eleusine coracana subsp. coracana]|nr:hypothetical protein QOZ80_7AG0554930 [Eleusine coracana subsp. coracana]